MRLTIRYAINAIMCSSRRNTHFGLVLIQVFSNPEQNQCKFDGLEAVAIHVLQFKAELCKAGSRLCNDTIPTITPSDPQTLHCAIMPLQTHF